MKITFLTEEWTQSTKDSCSTLMRQMAIELSRIENVEIGILIPSASPKDRKDTQKYNIKVLNLKNIQAMNQLIVCSFLKDLVLTLSLVMALSLMSWTGHLERPCRGSRPVCIKCRFFSHIQKAKK